jgi:ABC-type nitrate/sulfonate/bicarbonate transport system ATPase subunit
MASVTYDHVVKRYTADLTVVKDFNVEIKDKEFMVLVGPSGCGKSTALRMLAGLEAISEGQIRIGDRVVNNVAAKDRDIAMVFQSYALYPHMSVYDNMAFPLQMQHMKKDDIDKRVKNASRILGLDNFLKRKPRALSGGQRQRVALGRAIVRSPKVFLLDEPLSNLDAKLRGQTRIELQKLHRDLETTFIYVTHARVPARGGDRQGGGGRADDADEGRRGGAARLRPVPLRAGGQRPGDGARRPAHERACWRHGQAGPGHPRPALLRRGERESPHLSRMDDQDRECRLPRFSRAVQSRECMHRREISSGRGRA